MSTMETIHLSKLPEYFRATIKDNLLSVTELHPGNEPAAACRKLCIIPYKNPKRTQPEIFFYKASHTKDYSINTYGESSPVKLIAQTNKEEYIARINFLKEHIQRGNIYEINYCVEFSANNVVIDPVSVFTKLNSLTKAPYASMVRIGEHFIISASPELFLKKENNLLYTKPIKGTIRRGENAEEDERLKLQLYKSVKERTENVMAVDVARNDLSKIAMRGTVSVNKLYNIETYKTVHHMVSTVQCELQPEVSFSEIINATFPMASMTGAPKVKAMDLIDETENFKRHFYSGAMGMVEQNGDFELSVNIRSIFYNVRTKRLSIAVGSAITHLCEPEKEYEECLLKANALLKALNATVS